MRANRNILAVALVFCTFPALAFAQKAPSAPPTSGGTSRTTSTPPASRPTTPAPQTQPLMMMYSGKVHIAGAVLQDAAKVVARCFGGRAPAALYSVYTDLKGNFTLTFGQNQVGAPMDASVDPIDPIMGGIRATQMMQCDLTASAPGYVSSQMTVQFRSSLDNTEMGKLVLTPIGGTQDMGGIVSIVSLQAPQKAQNEYAKGIKDLRDNKIENAEKHFRKATEEYPKYAVAWEKLGTMQMTSDAAGARHSFLNAIEADPKFVPPYLAIATLDASESKWDQVLEITNRAIAIDPQHFAHAYFLNGAANLNLGNMPAAEKSALRAAEIDKQHLQPRIELLLAEIFDNSNRPTQAAEHFRKYLEISPDAKDAGAVRTRLAKLEVASSK